MLRSPVKRTVWVRVEDFVAKRPRRLGGLSALASYSMLTEPKWPVFAVTNAEWKAATGAGVRELPEPVAGARSEKVTNVSMRLRVGGMIGRPSVHKFS